MRRWISIFVLFLTSTFLNAQPVFIPESGVLKIPSVEIAGTSPLEIYELELTLSNGTDFRVSDISQIEDSGSLKHAVITCVNTSGNQARLDCLQELGDSFGYSAPSTSPTEPEVSEQGTGGWRTSISTNPLDDTTTAFISITATSGENEWGDKPVLAIRCRSGVTDLYILWEDYLGLDVYVTTRIGSEVSQSSEWSLSTDSEASFYRGNDIAFIQRLIGQSSFVAQTTPYADAPVTGIFNIYGLSNSIVPVRQTCNW